MPSYSIYLPPELAALHAVRPSDLPISFRSIPRPQQLDTLSTLDPRESLLDRTRSGCQQDRKGKRKAITDLLEGDNVGRGSHGISKPPAPAMIPTPPAISTHPAQGDKPSPRRRSRRLHNSSKTVPFFTCPTHAQTTWINYRRSKRPTRSSPSTPPCPTPPSRAHRLPRAIRPCTTFPNGPSPFPAFPSFPNYSPLTTIIPSRRGYA
jgi:hypothetical protein